MKSKSLKTNFIWNSIGSFVYLFCQWLLTWLIVKLSPDMTNAGNLSLAISIANVFYTISCFNMRPFLVSDNTGEYSVEDYSSFRFLTIVASIFLCLIYILLFNYTLDQIICIILYMFFKIGEAIVDLFHGFEQRKDRMDIGGISLLVRGIITVTIFTLGMKLLNNMNLSLLLIIISTYLFIFFYDFNNVKKFEVLKIDVKNVNLKKIFISLLPLAIGSFLSTISTALPRQFLEKIIDTKTLGIYATIATPAVIVQVAATYIYNPLLVSFSDYKKNKQYKEFKKLFIKTIIVIIALSIFALLGSVLFGKILLSLLYGEAISEYNGLFNIIIIYTAMTGILWFLNNILIIFRKIKEILLIDFIGFMICACTSSLFIKAFGLDGVTYTLIVFTLVMIFLMIGITIKNIKKLA